MLMFDNAGNVVAEQNVGVDREGNLIVSNTMYDSDRVVSQSVSVSDTKGNSRSANVYGRKVLP